MRFIVSSKRMSSDTYVLGEGWSILSGNDTSTSEFVDVEKILAGIPIAPDEMTYIILRVSFSNDGYWLNIRSNDPFGNEENIASCALTEEAALALTGSEVV